jgi:hypothetical protein
MSPYVKDLKQLSGQVAQMKRSNNEQPRYNANKQFNQHDSRHGNRNRTPFQGLCYTCNQPGHRAVDCPSQRQNNQGN